MLVHYLRVIKFHSELFKNVYIFISPNFCIFFYLSGTWNGSFLCTVDGVHLIYITSVIFPCMVGLAAPIDTESKAAVFTLVYNLLPHSPFLFLLQKIYCLFHLHFFSVGGILLRKWPLNNVVTIKFQ
jgi:hypothetical protein